MLRLIDRGDVAESTDPGGLLFEGEDHPLLPLMREHFERMKPAGASDPGLPDGVRLVVQDTLRTTLRSSQNTPDDPFVCWISWLAHENAWDNSTAFDVYGQREFARLRRWVNFQFRVAYRARGMKLTSDEEVMYAQAVTLFAVLLIPPDDVWSLPTEGEPNLKAL